MQMLLIDLQSLGVTGVVTLGTERAVGRGRPYTQDCGPGGAVRGPSGELLYNHCSGGGGDYQSPVTSCPRFFTTVSGRVIPWASCASAPRAPFRSSKRTRPAWESGSRE
jgi:hypothetical protein